MRTDKIIPYEKNAKRHTRKQVQMVANSIKEFGFNQPIVIDKNNVVIVGHGRLEAARLLGMKEVPTVTVKLSEEQAAAYRLADNKLNESEWDMSLVIEELKGLSPAMIDLTGFEKKLIPLQSDEDDEVPEISGKVTSRTGDVYDLGRHRVVCGDCTNDGVINRLMGSNRIDLIITDPPYGIDIIKNSPRLREGKNLGTIGAENKAKIGRYKPVAGDDTTDIARAFYEKWKGFSDGQIIFGGNYFTDFLPPSRGWIVWDKKNGGTTFADAEIAWTSFDKSIRLYEFLWSGMRRGGPRRDEGKLRSHPTQKPVGLLLDIISEWAGEVSIIGDPFLGSGSSLIACEKTGKACYGIEIDPYYVDVIVQRYVEYTGSKNIIKNGKKYIWITN